MTTTFLMVFDLVAAAIAAGSLAGAAAVSAGLLRDHGRAKARLVLLLVGTSLIALAGEFIFTALLGQRGWWFVQEKVLLALPLAAVTSVILCYLLLPLVAVARGRARIISPLVPTALVAATAGAAGGIAARQLIGYPLTIWPALVLVLLVALATGLAFELFTGGRRRVTIALASFTALVLVGSVGSVWLADVSVAPALASAHHALDVNSPAAGTSVADLRTPDEVSGTVRSFELEARHERVTLSSGATVTAWTYGSLPGPEIRVDLGDLLEVTLYNLDIDAGVTIHWHGFDVPNGEDGVAGVTQDAVLPGESFTYRFVADEPGTYWYHTHQVSADGVQRGLYGTFIVLPRTGHSDVDLAVPIHAISGIVLLGDANTISTRKVEAGQSVRLRLINTDQVPRRFRVAGVPFLLVAVDGRDLAGPTPITNSGLRIPAGGRNDVTFTMPSGPVQLTTDASSRASLVLSPSGSTQPPPAEARGGDLDLLSYGEPVENALTPGDGRVEATMVLDRLPRFVHGLPRQAYTVDGAVFPHIESIEVVKGNRLTLTVVNRGWETHPMHIHGHHVLVISRDGVPSTGSPLMLDTFDVQPGEVWVVALIADNPGIWMDHCHNLDHAAEGMMMALRYRGITSPYEQGGAHGNRSE